MSATSLFKSTNSALDSLAASAAQTPWVLSRMTLPPDQRLRGISEQITTSAAPLPLASATYLRRYQPKVCTTSFFLVNGLSMTTVSSPFPGRVARRRVRLAAVVVAELHDDEIAWFHRGNHFAPQCRRVKGAAARPTQRFVLHFDLCLVEIVSDWVAPA